MKKFLLLLLPIGLVVFAFFFAKFHPYLDRDFALEDLQGNVLQLGKFAGRPIILVFFSPRCGDCKEEMPYLKELYSIHQEQGLIMVGVGIRNKKDIEDFVQEQGVPFPVVVDETLEVSKSFGVFFLPHVVFFDKQGKITYSKAGKISQEELTTNLKSIL
ncbi:MAG: TlpA family protein disulfide reductase [Atribacterota bacterium]|nr:TlpA family protein disulfide reductase [Atribacterota bacterium]